jgi:glycosyltransferase involved in cell wall biosynthesis
MIEFNVVIATYNSAATLERCLESVRAISPAVSCNVVLIDGASTDNTLEIAEKYSDILNIVVSEPDCGIYDAWNKGLTYCTHRWVMFLGSDDYICPTAFLDYVTFIQRQRDADFVSCQVRYVDADGRIIRTVGRPWDWRLFRKYMCALHPGSFTSMDYFERVGKTGDCSGNTCAPCTRAASLL